MTVPRTKKIIVHDCDTCVLKAINGSNSGGVTICSINKLADTFRCTYGLVPKICPLLEGDIVVKIIDSAEIMKEQSNEENNHNYITD